MSVFGNRVATLCILLLIPVFVSGSALAVARQSVPVVDQLSVDPNGDTVEVSVAASGDVRYTYFSLDGPRLVVDLHDTQNRLGFSQKTVQAGGVDRIRAAEFTDATREATRIVFDLQEGTTFSLSEDSPGHIRVRFQNTDDAPAALAAGPETGVGDETEVSAPVAAASAAAVPEREEAAPVQVASLVPTFPRQVAASPTAGSQIPAAQVPEETLSAESRIAAIGETEPFPEPVVDPPAGAPGPAVPLSVLAQAVSQVPTPEYTGDVYDWDLRGVELQDFFRTIHDISGLNIILHNSVPNTPLTLSLGQVPWDQVLDVVLRNHDLTWELQGNVLQIISRGALQEEQNRRRQYQEEQALNAPMVSNVYVLSYARADAAASLVEELLSERGRVIPVPDQNALIIDDIETRTDSIRTLIDFIDTPAQQVEIEARLLQASKTFRRDLGSQLGVIFNNNGSNVLTGLPTLPSPFERAPAPSATAGGVAALPLIADFGIAAPTAGISYLMGVGGDVLLDSIIQVAETRGTARLLSRPSMITQNNTSANISQGFQIPVQTRVNETITTQYQEFALRLDVTPQITEEGTILLSAVIENSTPDFSQEVLGIPAVATQQAQTTVLVPDGGTMMIGGILIDSDTVSVNQVPGLGSIPILGHLFKSTSTVKSTSELLFFVTARIKPADPIDFLSAGQGAGEAAGLPDSIFLREAPEAVLRDGLDLGGLN